MAEVVKLRRLSVMPTLALVATRASPMALLQQVVSALVFRHPVLLLLLLRALEALYRYWVRRRLLRLGRLRVLNMTDEIDGELIQGCLLSTERLLEMGRVEKRTLFTQSLISFFSENVYLAGELVKAAQKCRRKSKNCMVTRWMPEDEKYHSLQAALNAVSSLFGANFVHFNALDGDASGLFKSTWYCLTLTTPTRLPHDKRAEPSPSSSFSFSGNVVDNTCTFTDMSRIPRPTLRVLLVNETELRRIGDNKLRPPNWGFFNSRHAERYRMLVDFARNFQKQLVRTSADGRAMNERNPFTSEKVHKQKQPPKPDGGLMKRVHSVPHKMGILGQAAKDNSAHGEGLPTFGAAGSKADRSASQGAEELDADRCNEYNCFLRVHVPHYVGYAVGHAGGSHKGLPAISSSPGSPAKEAAPPPMLPDGGPPTFGPRDVEAGGDDAYGSDSAGFLPPPARQRGRNGSGERSPMGAPRRRIAAQQ